MITELASVQLVLNFPTVTELGKNINFNNNDNNKNYENKKLVLNRILNMLTKYMNGPKIDLHTNTMIL